MNRTLLFILITLFLFSGCSKYPEDLICESSCCKPAEHCSKSHYGVNAYQFDKNGCLKELYKKKIIDSSCVDSSKYYP